MEDENRKILCFAFRTVLNNFINSYLSKVGFKTWFYISNQLKVNETQKTLFMLHFRALRVDWRTFFFVHSFYCFQWQKLFVSDFRSVTVLCLDETNKCRKFDHSSTILNLRISANFGFVCRSKNIFKNVVIFVSKIFTFGKPILIGRRRRS